MSERKLNQAIEEIRKQQPSEAAVQQAGRKVFGKLFDSAYLPEPVARITGCGDFQALMGPYLEGELAPARVALLEDHVGSCVACRRALREMRTGPADRTTPSPVRSRTQSGHRWGWFPLAVAATLLVGLTIGITGAFHGMLPGQHAVRATVVSVQGTLYRISGLGYSMVKAGEVIKNADELRTGKGSRAIFRLLNGAELEMAERSDVSVSGGWRGPSINLERGHVIVQTADTDQRPFYLSTADLVIPVRDEAVLSLNRGTKGSRVAMAKGFARVELGQKTSELRAGQQVATERLASVPIATEFAWSTNADHYSQLLSDLTSLGNELKTIRAPALRYQTELAKYLPEKTMIFAAIPNLGGTLTEAKRIFDQHLAESEVLREWWQQQPAGREGNLDQVLTQLSSISRFLGNEIVLAVPAKSVGQFSAPIVLAKIEQNGLREYLLQNLPKGAEIHILDNGVAAGTVQQGLTVSLDHGVLIASPDAKQVQSAAALAASGSDSGFEKTAFYGRIAQSYTTGAEYLLSVDMEQFVTNSVGNPKEIPPGFGNAKYLALERRDANNDTQTRAALSFAGARSGIPSWLGTPGPMGSLDFVSPDATFAAAAVVKAPQSILQEFFSYMKRNEGDAKQDDKAVAELASDAAAALGGDIAFALDGPLLPVPAWKLAIEVYDANRLNQTISLLVDHVNQSSTNGSGKLQVSDEQVNGQTFHAITHTSTANYAIYYTFVDGYMVASSTKANLMQAIQDRQAKHTLASSNAFRDQIPADGYTNFSAIVFHHVGGGSLGAVANGMSGAPLPAGQRKALATLLANTAPGLICVYGERDRIVAVTKDSFLGFNLGTLVGLEQGKPVMPLLASAVTATGQGQTVSKQVRR